MRQSRVGKLAALIGCSEVPLGSAPLGPAAKSAGVGRGASLLGSAPEEGEAPHGTEEEEPPDLAPSPADAPKLL